MSLGDSHSAKNDLKDSLNSESARTVVASTRKVTIPDILSDLQATDPPTIQFPSQVERVVAYQKGAIVGLSSGLIAVAGFAPTTSVEEMEGSPNHTERISCLALTPDERLLVSGSRDNLVKLWTLPERRELATLSGHTASVTCVAVTADGKVCVSGSRDNSIRVWSVEGRKALATLAGHTSIITCLSLTPDNGSVVTGSFDNSVKLWSLATQRETAKFASHSYSVYCLLVTADGKLCVSGSADNAIKLWDVESKREVGTLVGHSNYIRCLSATQDGKLCASGSGDCTVKIWDIEERKEVATFIGHFSFITALVITLDGKMCISGSSDSLIKVWSLTEFREIASLSGHNHWITCLVLSCDQRSLISGSSDNSLKQWSLDQSYEPALMREKPVPQVSALPTPEKKSEDKWTIDDRREVVTPGSTNEITCIAVTPDSKFVLSGSTDSVVRMWSVAERQECCSFTGHTGAVTCIGLTPDGRYCVSGAADAQLKLWSVEERRLLATFSGHADRINCLAVSQDGKLCVSGSADTSLIVWSIAELGEVMTLTGHSDWLDCVLLTADSLYCISSSRDLLIKVWHIPTASESFSLSGHTADIYCLSLTPDGRALVSGSADNSLRVWSLSDKKEVGALIGHTDWIYCLAISPDGKVCVSGSADCTVKVWSLKTFKEIASFAGHTAEISSISISADNSLCVSGSYDHSLRLWSLSELREMAALVGHEKEVICLAVSGRLVASGGADNTVLSQCIPLPQVETESLSASSLLISSIDQLKGGSQICEVPANCVISPYNLNSLHVSAYYTHRTRLRDYLAIGVPILRGSFGSPLTVSIEKKSIKCIDAILEYLIARTSACQNDSVWPLFLAIDDDVPALLYCNSRLLVPFFNVVLQKSAQLPLPEFVAKPRKKLPMTAFIDHRYIDTALFDRGKKGNALSEPVDFLISLIKLNVHPGAQESVTVLKALKRCKNKEILTTQVFLNIIDEKWNYFFGFTLTLTTLYMALLVNLNFLVFHIAAEDILLLVFLCLNSVFLLLECAFAVATKGSHWKESGNLLELLRASASLAWCLIAPHDLYFTLALSLLCFVRGFAYFRCFRRTRLYVHLAAEVLTHSTAFLILACYALYFVSMFGSVLTTSDSPHSPQLVLFPDNEEGELPLIVFSLASVASIVIVLNLLISVFEEAYQKALVTLQRADVLHRLKLVLEYELLLFWRRHAGRRSAAVICSAAEGCEEEWSGAVLEIEKCVRNGQRAVETELARVGGVEASVEDMRGKLGAVEGRVKHIEAKIEEVDDKLERLFDYIKART